MKLEEFLKLKDPSVLPEKELLIFHLRLHEWFENAKEDKKKLGLIIEAHTKVLFEFVRRHIHHEYKSELDCHMSVKILREEFPNYYTAYVEEVSTIIPSESKCTAATKKKLVQYHTSIHTLWSIVSQCDKVHPSEDFLNAHGLLVSFLTTNCNWKHPEWDSLDKPMFTKVFFYSENSDQKPEVLTLYEFLEKIPKRIVIKQHFVELNLKNKLIYVDQEFGSKLVQVCYFRILRYLKPRDWDFVISDSSLDSVDLEYSLVLERCEPFMTVHLNLGPQQFGREVKITAPFLYLVGGLATRGYTTADIDLLLRGGLENTEIFESLITDAIDCEGISFVPDKGLAPYTSYVGLMDLSLVAAE